MGKPDINDPETWKRYRSGLCDGCSAACCTMPVEVRSSDLLRLELISEDELEDGLKKAARRLEKAGIVRSFRAGTGVFLLTQQADGACVFLTKERRCSVYEKRPDTCRNFPKVSSRPGFCPANRS